MPPFELPWFLDSGRSRSIRERRAGRRYPPPIVTPTRTLSPNQSPESNPDLSAAMRLHDKAARNVAKLWPARPLARIQGEQNRAKHA